MTNNLPAQIIAFPHSKSAIAPRTQQQQIADIMDIVNAPGIAVTVTAPDTSRAPFHERYDPEDPPARNRLRDKIRRFLSGRRCLYRIVILYHPDGTVTLDDNGTIRECIPMRQAHLILQNRVRL